MSTKPSYCPACGEALPEGERFAKPMYDEKSGDGSYDVYCPRCGWSGDIWPDAEQGVYAGEGPTSTPSDYSPPSPRIRRR